LFRKICVMLVIVLLSYPLIYGQANKRDFSEHPIMSTNTTLNYPPENVSISGPYSGRVGEPTEYSFYCDDPDGDNVSYYIKWEGSCPTVYGPYESSTSISISYVWITSGFYTISFKAVDVYGAESEIVYFDMVMPRTSNFRMLFFLNHFFNFSFFK